MARQVRRISELPEATELTGDELLEIVQDGENHRLRVGQLSGGSGKGLPGGGAQGQVLTKLSDDDFDADWETSQGGGVSWGGITGDIEDQVDLVLFVDSKIGDIGLILDSINGEIV